MIEWLLILSIIFIGSICQGYSGIGFGILSVGILTMYLPVKDSTLLILALTCILSVSIMMKLRHHVRLKAMYLFLICAFAGRGVSFLILGHYGNALWMKKVLGVILILLVLRMIFSRAKSSSWIAENVVATGAIAFIGSLVGGLFAVGGPILVIYFLARFADKKEYQANLQLAFLSSNLLTLTMHGIKGDIPETVLYYFIPCAIAAYIGVRIGQMLFHRLSTVWVQRIAYGIVFVSGVQLLVLNPGS